MPNSKLFSKKISFDKLGEILFLIGIFFLCSSLFVSSIFLITSFVIGSIIQCKKSNYFKDKWNFPFLLCGLLILLNSLIQRFILPNDLEGIWDPNLSLIGMANWIPFFWIFWACQPFINSKAKRKKFALVLISGTLPLLITGFGQFFFKWTGPFETLKGLIIWYQRPIEAPAGLSGLFNNQNYAGTWLNFVLPFSMALLLEKRGEFYRKLTAFSFLFSIGLSAFLTYSRNAWLGLLVSVPIMIGKKRVNLLLPIMVIVLFTLFFIFSPLFNGEMQDYVKSFLPEKILLEFASEGYQELDAKRIEIFSSAISLIKTSPIFGTGAASFPVIYLLETTSWKGHSHNLLIELAISYGLPASIIFFSTINIFVFLSGRVIFFKERFNDISLFDRAFWVALLFFLISQLADIQYFDGKISLVAWILLSGIKNIIEEHNNNVIFKSK